jgi:Na+/H+ antiporter NhaC
VNEIHFFEVFVMFYILQFLPFFLFVFVLVGTGSYFALRGVPDAFSQLSPTVAIIPAIMLGWVLYRGKKEEKMAALVGGICHRDIITMCLIFLLAGAFCAVTQDIGSIQSMVNLSLSFIQPRFLLIGLFLVSAFVSIAIGTSMGTIAAIGPIAASMGHQTHFPLSLAMATVIGGAMFGDNLSIVSDTTIAAVLSQGADMRKKFRFNMRIALATGAVTLMLLFAISDGHSSAAGGDYSILLICPYFVLLLLALNGVNVVSSLLFSIIVAGLLGRLCCPNYPVIAFSASIYRGFASMHELMVLTMFIGGLSGLIHRKFMERTATALASWSAAHGQRTQISQLLIGILVSIFGLLFANNTVAIIFCGGVCKEVSHKSSIPPHVSATWLSTFSCIVQGIIPYGPQLMLAGTIGGLSPLSILPHVYYCYLLLIVSLLVIFRSGKKREKSSS